MIVLACASWGQAEDMAAPPTLVVPIALTADRDSAKGTIALKATLEGAPDKVEFYEGTTRIGVAVARRYQCIVSVSRRDSIHLTFRAASHQRQPQVRLRCIQEDALGRAIVDRDIDAACHFPARVGVDPLRLG